ncbi:MFS transporter [Spirillospora sp. NPDC048911]|uniref:MFS transporter n=1 Tax=Spirillospora sp. NPDC048911 TaxID=3364527 RepID=UPI003715F94B
MAIGSSVSGYRGALRGRDFRLLWLGSSVSLVGDGMTFIALTWLVLSRPGGVQQLGLLTVCFTLPVVAGGVLVGPLLDRFDKRYVLAADSVLRGLAVASVPAASVLGSVPVALPFVVAAFHGLLKMVPLAGFPAAIPDLVNAEDRDAANALEMIGFGITGMAGPALGGLLVAHVGAEGVLALDAASYAVFAVTALAVRRPPAPERPTITATADAPRPLLRDRVLIVTTVAFMAFNIAEGMLLVIGPWLAKFELVPSGPQTLGLLFAALSVGELGGALAAGAVRPRSRPLNAIAAVQLTAAAGFLGLLATPSAFGVAAGFFVIGLFSAPMTVWAQTVRMERIPAHQRGRAFAALRTLMQATPPIGAVLAAPLLKAELVGTSAFAMALLAGFPALMLPQRPRPRPRHP